MIMIRWLAFSIVLPLLATTVSVASAQTVLTQTTPTQTAPGPVGLRSWGYQLQNIDPAKLAAVAYDAIVIDYARDGRDSTALAPAEVERLKFKPDGTRRVLLAYMSIGEAEDYRFYWKSIWGDHWLLPNIFTKPAWRAGQNTEWGGNYAVRYWEPAWQEIILGSNGYLDRILKAGFDGVWLDKVDSSVEDVAKGRVSAKADMIAFVRRIADKGRAARPGFLIFPQNGEALLADAGYRALIDGFGKEDLLYGEDDNGRPNGAKSISANAAALRPLVAMGKPVLAVEYLDDPALIDAARRTLSNYGFAAHFADRNLSAMRVGDHAGTVATAAKPTRGKSRVKEASAWETWKTRFLIAAAIGIVVLGIIRGK